MTNRAEHVDPFDGFDLREYRNAVAKFVRLMIRARAKVQPRSIKQSEHERWSLQDITTDAMSLERLLLAASAAYDHLWRKFMRIPGRSAIARLT